VRKWKYIKNICRAWFFRTINDLIVSVCVGIVFTVLINMHGDNNIKYIQHSNFGNQKFYVKCGLVLWEISVLAIRMTTKYISHKIWQVKLHIL
jgi:hypothetical protein